MISNCRGPSHLPSLVLPVSSIMSRSGPAISLLFLYKKTISSTLSVTFYYIIFYNTPFHSCYSQSSLLYTIPSVHLHHSCSLFHFIPFFSLVSTFIHTIPFLSSYHTTPLDVPFHSLFHTTSFHAFFTIHHIHSRINPLVYTIDLHSYPVSFHSSFHSAVYTTPFIPHHHISTYCFIPSLFPL